MSNTTSSMTKAEALAQVQALIAGIQKHFPNGNFTLGNTAFTTASLVQLLQSLADAMTALNTAQKSAKDALTTKVGTETKVEPVLQALRKFVLAAFSNAAQTLADFGIQAPKAPTPLTVEQKVAAAAKARATRTVRGTTSTKKKLAISGNVTGVTITPSTTPASPSPTASNASSAPAPAPTSAVAPVVTK
jgi:hypothetical protein